ESDLTREAMILGALRTAVADERGLPMPASWPAMYEQIAGREDAKLADIAFELAVAFGDEHAFPKLRSILADPKADVERRRNALETLSRGRDFECVFSIQKLLGDPKLRKDELKALAGFEHPTIAPAVLAHWSTFPPEERAEAVTTL